MKNKKPEYKSGWEQHFAEEKEGRRIMKEEGLTDDDFKQAR